MSNANAPDHSVQEAINKVARGLRGDEDIAFLTNPSNFFAHYTSADTVNRIADSRGYYLRNCRLMNDYSEVLHGYSLVDGLMEDASGKRYLDAWAQIHSSIPQRVEWVLKGGAAEIAHNCFVFSLCQHREPEDREGKLSMWRAYGSGDIRVAVIAKTIPALQFAQGVLPTPVLYGDRDMVRRELEAKAQLVDDQISALRSLPPDLAAAQAARLLINMAVAIKHPGFCEEQEWRFVYLPITPSQQMEAQRQGVVFGGVPQVVYKMPITLPKDEGYDPTANFFQKIILGPCAESETVRAGLVALLAGYGFNNPDPLVTKCGIPYRPRM